MSRGVDLPQRQFVMILVVQDVHQVGIERVDILKICKKLEFILASTKCFECVYEGLKSTKLLARATRVSPSECFFRWKSDHRLCVCARDTNTHTHTHGHTYLQLGEVRENLRQLVMIRLLRELHFAHVKLTNSPDGIVLVNHCWRFTLCF